MRHALVLFAALFLLSAPASFGAQSRIDQEQPAVDNAVPAVQFGFLGLTKSGRRLAQVFTPALSGPLTHITVPMACEATTTLTVSLQTVASGVPSGFVLASETISGDTYPPYTAPYSTVPDAGFRLIQMYLQPIVYADTEYAIVFSASGKCSILAAPNGDLYTRGRAYSYSPLGSVPGWTPLAPPNGPSDDLPFQTFVDANQPIIR